MNSVVPVCGGIAMADTGDQNFGKLSLIIKTEM